MADIQAGDGTQQIPSLTPSLADLDNDGVVVPKQEPANPDINTDTDPDTGIDKVPDDTDKTPDKQGDDKQEDDKQTNDDEITPEAFFAEVNKLHGFDVAVTYPEGVDPLSPEGVHARDKVLIETVIANTHEQMKAADPRGYAYLLHRQAGGDDASFFEKPSNALPEYSAFKDSVDLQRQVLTADLVSKGLTKEVADAVVDKAIADKKLFDYANNAYQAKEAADKQALDKATADAQAKKDAEEKAITDTLNAITDIVMQSKLDAIVIPDAKRAEFAEYVKQHLYFDGEQFFITKPINEKTLAEALQTEFFGFVKGNLKELVERRAKTQNAQTMRLRASKTNNTTKSSGGGQSSGFVALGDL